MYLTEKKRIQSLDIMRGFAIFGIFLVNMLSFHSPMLYLDPFTWWNNTADRGIYIVIDVLVQGSFYPLFSLLFGYGMVILYERTKKRGVSFTPIAMRRLLMLLAIGIVHAFFIWHGDILITYAIFGILLLLFLRLSGTGMFLTGLLFWLIPNILLSLLLVISVMLAPAGDMSIYDISMAKQSVEIYQQGSFWTIFEQRFEDWYAVNNLLNGIFMLFSIFPFFLIGGGAAKGRWMERVQDLKSRFILSFLFFSIIGLFLKLSPYVLDRNLAYEYIQDSIGGPMLAIAFALGIALLTEKWKNVRLLQAFASVGRLSMSNYLIQSIVSTLLFYSYGFGLYGKVSVLTGTIMVLVIFVGQIIFSSYWMKNHHYGPIEWVWRSVTYKRKQPWSRLPFSKVKKIK